jgi:glycine cleavage system aminomethyltransferase T
VPATVVRIDGRDGLAWELHAPAEFGGRLWDVLRTAGELVGAIPIGSLVGGTTARLEAGLRSRTADLIGGYDVVEAGLIGPSDGVKAADFIGRAAVVHALDGEPAARLCTLVVEDHTSPIGQARFMVGNEPIVTPDGELIVDAKGRRSFVTSAGSAPSLGWHVLNAYLPAGHAAPGTRLAVEYFGDRYPVRVVSVGSVPLAPRPGAPSSA